MSQILITERQLGIIEKNYLVEKKIQEAQLVWETFTEEQKKSVINLYQLMYPETKKKLNEAWYNTLMDFIGIVDPTPITDTINAISYFSQGETLFGVLTLIAALPFFVGDFVTKPIVGLMKAGSKETKALEAALKTTSTAAKGSVEYEKALATINKLAEGPGAIGTFLQKAGGPSGWATKVNNFIKDWPAGPFKGMKNTIMDYFTLLSRVGQKGKNIKGLAKTLEAEIATGKVLGSVQKQSLIDAIKAEKIFDKSVLSKPNFLAQTFFGGLPRLFRSSEGRRVKIMMQQTKWWLGFLDYVGVGNFIGPEELSKKMNPSEMEKAMQEYNKTPQAQQYYAESLKGAEAKPESQETSTSTPTTTTTQDSDPLQNFLRKLLMGQANPLKMM